MQTISLSGTEELPSRFPGASSTPSPSAQVGVLVGDLSVACRVCGISQNAEQSQVQPWQPTLSASVEAVTCSICATAPKPVKRQPINQT